MRLEPLATSATPAYPPVHRRLRFLGRWMRGAIVAASASCALLIGGCYGATTPREQEPDPDPDPRPEITPLPPVVEDWPGEDIEIGGVRMAPSFICSEEEPVSLPTDEYGGYLEGHLCGEQTAWAAIDLLEETRVQIDLSDPGGAVLVDVTAPDDTLVGQLGPESPSAELVLPAGRTVLAATSADPVGHSSDYFWVTYAPVGDP